ncbi:MAG TPA: hypothetical protein VNK43_03475, partial [Gemmatimonadales bacterium]|nr:hypothetical protein [Gemmatimonadales bacterium]
AEGRTHYTLPPESWQQKPPLERILPALFPTDYGLLFEAAGHADTTLGLATGAIHGTLAGLALPLPSRARPCPSPARAVCSYSGGSEYL